MADGATRKKLVWIIQKNLFQLSEDQLHKMASEISGEMTSKPPDSTGNNEAELHDYVVSYMNSDHLRELEDQGLSKLLRLLDLALRATEDRNGHEPSKTPKTPEEHITSDTSAERVHSQASARPLVPVSGTEGTSPTLHSGLVRLSDVATLV